VRQETINSLQLTAVQLAWLQELGLERAYLGRIARAQSGVAVPERLSVMDTAQLKEAATVPHSTVDAAGRTETNQSDTSHAQPQSPPSSARPPASLQEAINALRKAANIRPSSVAANSEQVESTEAQSLAPLDPKQLQVADINQLAHVAEDCSACALHQTRSRVIFGRGATQTVQWLVLADSPSDADDKTGVALDSHAGALLSAMLHSVGLDEHNDCYVTHLAKCRSMATQGPSAEEFAACNAFFLKQVDLLAPSYLLVLGQQAANQLLGSNEDIDQLRSKIHHWQSPQGRSIPVVVTYHPASLLLRPQHKANAWRDLSLVRGLTHTA